jgi:hypothetical protein
MITVDELILASRQNGLDAEDSDFYDDERNFIPAINSAIKWIMSVGEAAMGQKRLREEAFGELTKAHVYQTSKYSRIQLLNCWGVLSVYALPTTIKLSDGTSGAIISNTNSNFTSIERDDLMHISSVYSCKRLTLEEWSDNIGNPYSPSNTVITSGDYLDYGYLSPFDYGYENQGEAMLNYIEVRPVLNEKLCTVFQIDNHPEIITVDDIVYFPSKIQNLLVQKITKYVATAESDAVDIYTATSQDIIELVTALS